MIAGFRTRYIIWNSEGIPPTRPRVCAVDDVTTANLETVEVALPRLQSVSLSMSEPFAWPPLESNPEIFTEYMHAVGMKKEWAIGEVFGFDEELLAFLPQACYRAARLSAQRYQQAHRPVSVCRPQPVLAVIANVERLKKQEDKARGSSATPASYYMRQTGQG